VKASTWHLKAVTSFLSYLNISKINKMIKSVHYQSKLSEKFVYQNLEKEPS